MNRRNLYFILILFFVSCTNEVKEELPIIVNSATRFIGHKGSGTYGEHGNLTWRDNSVSGIINAIQTLEGSEFDVQISKNKTLWVFHDHEILNCKNELTNIASLDDSIIKELSECRYYGQVEPLEVLMKEMQKFNFKGKTISLDLKVLQNQVAIELFGNSEALALYVSQELNSYKNHSSGIKIVSEVPLLKQYYIFKKHSSFETYLLLNNIESFKEWTPAVSTTIDVNTLLLEKDKPKTSYQLWTINDANDMLQAVALSPDFIQGDNLPLSKFFMELKKRKIITTTIVSEHEKKGINTSDEFFAIKKIDLSDTTENHILRFESQDIDSDDKIKLVFSSSNKANETIYWMGYDLKSDKPIYEFIDVDFILKNGGNQVHIYILNTAKSSFEMNGFKLQKMELN